MRGVALAMALLIAGTAEAGAYTAGGIGMSSCGNWTADRHSVGVPAYSDMSWVTGI
jgi:hypothetical protein